MDAANLKIQITADVNQAVNEMKKAQTGIENLSKSTEKSTTELSNTFVGMGGNISKALHSVNEKLEPFEQHLHKAFHSIFEGATEAGQGVTKMAASVAGSAGGIGLLVGVALAAAVAFYKFANAETESEKAQNKLNETLNDAAASVAGEVSQLTALVGISQNAALSTTARQQAIDKLNKDYPEYLGHLNLENIGTESVKKAIDAQTQSMIRRAQIRGAENLIAKETENLLRAQTELTIENVSKLDIAKGLLTSIFNPSGASANIAGKALDNQAEAAKNATTSIGIYTKKLNELLTASALAGDLFKPKELKASKVKVGKQGRQDDPFAVDLADLTDNLKDALAKVEGVKFAELQVNQEFLKKKLELYKKYGKYEGEINLEIAKNNRLVFEDQLRFIDSQRIALPKRANTEFDTDSKIDKNGGRNEILRTINPQIEENALRLEKAKARAEELAGVVTGVLSPAFDSFFNTLGSGGDAFGSFFQSLGKVIVELEKTIIKALIFGAIKAAITGGSFDIGNILGGVFGKVGGIKANAEGGVFTKPTLLGNYLFGEAGPEAIVPLNKFNEFKGGGNKSQTIIPDVRIQGNDLVILFDRATARRGRNG